MCVIQTNIKSNEISIILIGKQFADGNTNEYLLYIEFLEVFRRLIFTQL